MPRVQVYLPDDLHRELKRRGLPASELLQIALRAELERQDALDATATYLSELTAELGEPSAPQRAHADAIARRIRERGLGQAG
jgi:post-segregation antitoxin (ccd killing protein)